MMYEIGSNGLKPLTSKGKNDLKKGQLIEWRGNYGHKSVIYENLGIDKNNSSYGSKYMTITLNSYNKRIIYAYMLVYPTDDLSHTQHHYILDEIYSEEKTNDLYKLNQEKGMKRNEEKERIEIERKALVEKGRTLFEKYIPANAQALIIASEEIDDCDIMSDYFSTKTGSQVILGYSLHKKDLFNEMRKHANKIEETKHLAAKNEKYEHREKHSMGAGYYLKAACRYSTSWKIDKEIKWDDRWSEGLYVVMAKRCIFE